MRWAWMLPLATTLGFAESFSWVSAGLKVPSDEPVLGGKYSFAPVML